jgi:hypothetical protein
LDNFRKIIEQPFTKHHDQSTSEHSKFHDQAEKFHRQGGNESQADFHASLAVKYKHEKEIS